ncbi:hypothetical protein ACT4S5_17975, partial [Kocuria oceani]|uniref:hypothetical protein n=1 Tax=Kocuria oceani TaxID=988827 RepID=UPI004036FDF4
DRPTSPIAGRSTLPSRNTPAPVPDTEAKNGPKRPKANLRKTRVQPYVEPEIDVRLRSAYNALAPRDDSFSDFLEQMLVDRLQDLESTHNGGKPFPPVTKRLRTGPRMKMPDTE